MKLLGKHYLFYVIDFPQNLSWENLIVFKQMIVQWFKLEKKLSYIITWLTEIEKQKKKLLPIIFDSHMI